MSDPAPVMRGWQHHDLQVRPDAPAGGSGYGSSKSLLTFDPNAPFCAEPDFDSPAGRHAIVPPKPQRPLITADQTKTDKLILAMKLAIPMMPDQIRAKVASMLTPEALATLTAIAIAMVAAQFFGIGEILDVLLAGWAIWTIGPEALHAAKDLYKFASLGSQAKNDEEIKQAAAAFAEAVTIIGVDGLAAILAHKAFKALREGGEGAGGGSSTRPPPEEPVTESDPSSNTTPGKQTAPGEPAGKSGALSKADQMRQNAAQGKAFEQKGVKYLKTVQSDVQEQVSVRPYTDSGELADYRVRLDALGTDAEGNYKLTDFKSSETAPFTENQTSGYELIERNGGQVVGNNGGAAYPAGFQIPPTPVDVLKPGDF